MPYSNNSGGPWGNGGKNNDGKKSPWGAADDNKPGNDKNDPIGSVTEIDEIVRKGQEKLRSIIGGKGGSGGPNGVLNGGGSGFGRTPITIIILVLVAMWGYVSLYTVKPEQKSIELFLGSYYKTGESGLNFAPWPIVTAEVLTTTRENTEEIGVGIRGGRADDGLMLTGDENIVDIDFQVVWNISDPRKFLFNLADPRETIQAVSESAMRAVIARSELSPILNRDRA